MAINLHRDGVAEGTHLVTEINGKPTAKIRIWEEILKKQSVMVILCGSLISMMESQTLAYGLSLIHI